MHYWTETDQVLFPGLDKMTQQQLLQSMCTWYNCETLHPPDLHVKLSLPKEAWQHMEKEIYRGNVSKVI